MKNQAIAYKKPMTLSALLRGVACTTIAGSIFATSAVAQQALYSHGDPTVLEQQMLELVNRSRLNPAQEGVILNAVNTWYSVAARAQSPAFFTSLVAEFASYPAVAPLAFNPILTSSARQHAQDMVMNKYFSHYNLAGQSPTTRAAALGYKDGVGENIAGSGATNVGDILQSHFDLMVDYNNIDTSDPLGHRYNVLDSDYTEIGVGVIGQRVGGMITQEFGASAKSYILGVAYQDLNGNGRFDAGEGLGGITVTPASGNWYAVTSPSGGFAIPVEPVSTVTDTVSVPYPVQTTPWATIEPYNRTYRQQQIVTAPNTTVSLTWSGGRLAQPITTTVTVKTPVLKNYKVMGTDGWFYPLSMVTSQNVKTDLVPVADSLNRVTSNTGFLDFNGDGIPDLILKYPGGYLGAWCPDVSGGFKQWLPFNNGASFGAWAVVGAGDFNGDGVADLLLQYPGGYMAAWCPDATGTFKQWMTLNNGSSFGAWAVVGAGDFNGDGVADLLLKYPGGYMAAWCPDATGTFKQWMTLNNGSSFGAWAVTGVGDINGDGVADLLLQYPGGYMAAWCPDATGTFKQWMTLNNGASFGAWAVVSVSDFNGDGVPDLLLQYPGGYMAAWCPDATGTFKQWMTLNSSAPFGSWKVIR